MISVNVFTQQMNKSSTLAWKIPWTGEPGGLQPMGSQRVEHDWVTSLHSLHSLHTLSLEKEMAIHSITLAWKIPWTGEPDRLQSMGLQRVGHDWATSLSLSSKISWHWKILWGKEIPKWRLVTWNGLSWVTGASWKIRYWSTWTRQGFATSPPPARTHRTRMSKNIVSGFMLKSL